MEETAQESKKGFASEEDYHKAVYEALYALWEYPQLHRVESHKARKRLQGQEGEPKEDNEQSAVPESPSREHLREKFAAALRNKSFKEIREFLKATLTTLEFDPSEEVMQSVETILLHEQDGVTFINALELPAHPFYKGDQKTNCRVGYWRGDITILKIGSIVNAANAYMLGCFTPGHMCIDNVIHAKAGPRLRAECRVIMDKQGTLEETGQAKLTKAYCLPSKYVLHTVGPIVEGNRYGRGNPTPKQKLQLASCYRECLDAIKKEDIRSIAFCCISTGVFGYPQDLAAEVALQTVKEWLGEGDNAEHMDLVLFNVFTLKDTQIYEELFPVHFPAEVAASETEQKQQPEEKEASEPKEEETAVATPPAEQPEEKKEATATAEQTATKEN